MFSVAFYISSIADRKISFRFSCIKINLGEQWVSYFFQKIFLNTHIREFFFYVVCSKNVGGS